jgi:hypothetical protein
MIFNQCYIDMITSCICHVKQDYKYIYLYIIHRGRFFETLFKTAAANLFRVK